MSGQKSEQIGNYWLDEDLLKDEFRISTFYTKANHLAKNWRRCSMTADFWSKYYASDFNHKKISKKDFENMISFVLNELIENVGKYCDVEESDVTVKIFFHQSGQCVLKIDNLLTPQTTHKFKDTVKDLFTTDLNELYIQRLEHNLETGEGSGMGYLTMMQDYDVSLGFNFTENIQTDFSKAEISVRMNFE